jgi:hypothetical protein
VIDGSGYRRATDAKVGGAEKLWAMIGKIGQLLKNNGMESVKKWVKVSVKTGFGAGALKGRARKNQKIPVRIEKSEGYLRL